MEKRRKTPSFAGLSPASPISSRIKARNRSRDTKAELCLRSALWKAGLRYRKNVQDLPGKPDLVFPRARVVVFCDGDFWHGRNWEVLRQRLAVRANADYWRAKIAANRERDERTTLRLEAEGWTVLRFWETDIARDPGTAVQIVSDAVRRRCGDRSG